MPARANWESQHFDAERSETMSLLTLQRGTGLPSKHLRRSGAHAQECCLSSRERGPFSSILVALGARTHRNLALNTHAPPISLHIGRRGCRHTRLVLGDRARAVRTPPIRARPILLRQHTHMDFARRRARPRNIHGRTRPIWRPHKNFARHMGARAERKGKPGAVQCLCPGVLADRTLSCEGLGKSDSLSAILVSWRKSTLVVLCKPSCSGSRCIPQCRRCSSTVGNLPLCLCRQHFTEACTHPVEAFAQKAQTVCASSSSNRTA